jgi:RNA polymerase sigma-70 factor (ECF subfamily)
MEDFEHYRPLQFSIAYRMTGSASEAEDIVQESYLRYQDKAAGEIRSLKSFLTTIVIHLCLDYLKSARVEREQYIGQWLPEPVMTTDTGLQPPAKVEQYESISLAFLVLLETLTPPERAVFLLHEVFDYSFQEIAEIIDKSPANCRQIFHRAGQHLAERRQRFNPSPETHRRLIERFVAASGSGNISALTELLARDVTAWADGGGKVQTVPRPIFGQKAVARFYISVASKLSPDLTTTIEEVNGALALLGWMGSRLDWILTLDIVDEHIQGLRVVMNPDKLAFIQNQLEERQLQQKGELASIQRQEVAQEDHLENPHR